jgi:hypothetical protein
MAMLRLGTYAVTRLSSAPGGKSFDSLYIVPHRTYTGPITDVYIYFFRVPPSDMGYVTPTAVVATPQANEFDGYYKIVQTENPVFFSWATLPNDPSKLAWASIGTGDEPPGEGIIDLSP